MAKKHLLHVKSNQLVESKPKLPTINDIEYGELAINYADGQEKISLKSSTDNIRTISTDEQNNAKFETKERVSEIDEVTSKAFDTMNKSCGFNEEMTYIPQNELIQGTTSLAEAIEKVAEKANSGVDTSTFVLDLTEIPDAFATGSITISEGLYSKIQEAYNNGVRIALVRSYTDVIYKVPLNIINMQGGYFLNMEASIFISGFYAKVISLIMVQNASTVDIIGNMYLFPSSTRGIDNIRIVTDNTILECQMSGYSKQPSYSAITTSDSVGKAIGKLEAGINLSQQSWNAHINLSDYMDISVETPATGDIKNWEKLKPILEECSFHVDNTAVEINKKQLFIQIGPFIQAMRVDCYVSSGHYSITGSYVGEIKGSTTTVVYFTMSITDKGTTATFEVNTSST